ncbi:fimbrial biogenesis chaperone [Shewanella fidelis]|uniref:fimbrial biogenesis chaperone n=1 Tax=Shewanella fidelis TaxID=173509 RepID=UPI00048AF2CC|nr:molecular chaperone [Shewanella fidelis]
MCCKLKSLLIFFSVFLLLFAEQAHAGFTLGGTRLIVTPQDTQMIKVTNHGDTAYAMQAWAETQSGDNPGHALVISPSFAKLAGDSSLNLKVMSLSGGGDMEQLYYLNVQEIPPKAKKGANAIEANQVAFAIRTKIKVFVRPDSIAEERRHAEKAVTVSLSEDGKQLHINNPTPFYFTIDTASLGGNMLPVSKTGLVPPMAKEAIDIGANALVNEEVEINFIDDYGANRLYRYSIQ